MADPLDDAHPPGSQVFSPPLMLGFCAWSSYVLTSENIFRTGLQGMEGGNKGKETGDVLSFNKSLRD